ncbi:MAG: hypothetical protein ACYC5H_19300 [Methylovirgula sp.]
MLADISSMQHSFTLDTNCLIAIDEGRPEAAAVRKLANAHASGIADVAVVAMSASEKQKNGGYLKDFTEFRDRLASLDLAHLRIILPMRYWDIAFWDHCLLSDEAMLALEQRIHTVLFPNIEFEWQAYCQARDITATNAPFGNWRNCKCDVQVLWSHIHAKRDIFVTNDANFHKVGKKSSLIALGAKQIELPKAASSLLV